MQTNSLSYLLEFEQEILNEIELIMFDAEVIQGELTDEQAARIAELENQLISRQEDIFKKIDAIGYVISEMQSEVSLADNWAKSYQAAKKKKEERINRFKSYIARIMELNNITENMKGSIVTIKNISRKERIIIDKNLLPDFTKDAVFKIPVNEYNNMPEDLKKSLEQWAAKYEINESRALNNPEVLPGIEEKYKYNTSILGLNKFNKAAKDGK